MRAIARMTAVAAAVSVVAAASVVQTGPAAASSAAQPTTTRPAGPTDGAEDAAGAAGLSSTSEVVGVVGVNIWENYEPSEADVQELASSGAKWARVDFLTWPGLTRHYLDCIHDTSHDLEPGHRRHRPPLTNPTGT